MSQGHPAADTSLGVTYRTTWGRPGDISAFSGDVYRTSLGRNFAEWEASFQKYRKV